MGEAQFLRDLVSNFILEEPGLPSEPEDETSGSGNNGLNGSAA